MPIYINDSSTGVSGTLSQTLAAVTASFSGTNSTGPDHDGAIDRALDNVTASFINPGFGFPRLMSLAIGGGSRTSWWTQTTEGSETAAVACHMVAVLNFNKPAQGPSVEQTAVSNLRNWNPNILLACYKDPSAITTGTYEMANYYPVLTTEWTYAGSGGATDGDGLSRRVDGTINSSWANKYDVMMGNFSNEWNGYYPGEWIAEIRYDESYGTDTGANYDFVYWDVQNWFQRYEERFVDMNRDGTAEHADGGYDWDGNNDVWGPAKLTVKARIYNRINAKHLTTYGTVLQHFGNIGSWFDWFDGASASTDTLLESSQPTGINDYIQGGQIQRWERQSGYDDDGTLTGQTFENGFKSVARQLAYIKTSSLVGCRWICCDLEIDRTVSTRYQIARYLVAKATIAGAWVCWHDLSASRTVALLDEYVAGDIDSMTVAQIIAATGWLGAPVGPDPSYGTTYTEGSQGGVVTGTGSIGVYMREFENGLVICNPLGNGTQSSIPMPGNPGDYTRFLGGQDAVVNNGNTISSSPNVIAMAAATGLFLERT